MYLHIRASKNCTSHQIRIPSYIRNSLNIDVGDWLVFETTKGDVSVKVEKAFIEDVYTHGHTVCYVAEYSEILFNHKPSDVFVEKHSLTIGADPEFFLLYKNTVLPAHKYLSHYSQVGSDGDLAELRPDFAECPDQLNSNIKRLLVELRNKLPIFITPYASSWYEGKACGFHVHLGLPEELIAYATTDTATVLRNLAALLDYFVAIPSAALDTDDTRRLVGVKTGNYGAPSDFRLNMRTFEYRTPGGFNLKSHIYSSSLLTTAFCITDSFITESKKVTENWASTEPIANFSFYMDKYDIPDKKVIREILTTCDKKIIEEEAIKVRLKLSTFLKDYPQNIITDTVTTKTDILKEWLTDEEKSKPYICKKSR